MTPLTDSSRAAVTAMATNGLGGAVGSLLGTSAHAKSFLTVYQLGSGWRFLKKNKAAPRLGYFFEFPTFM